MLVGENGAGKSTLLTSILRIAEELHDEHGNGLKDYGSSPFPNKEYKDLGMPHMYIFVFKDNEKVHVFTSLQELDVKGINHLQYVLHNIGGKNKAELYESSDYPLADTTVLYLTNSLYSPAYRDVSYYAGLHTLAITPKTIDRIANKYFHGLCNVVDAYPYKRQDDLYLTWNWLTYRYRNDDEARDFQALVDLTYYRSLISTNLIDDFKGKAPVAFGLYAHNIVHIIRKYIGDVYDPGEIEAANVEILILCMAEVIRGWDAFLPNFDLFERILYLNLVFEAMIRSKTYRSVGKCVKVINANNKFDLFSALKYACHRFSGGQYTVVNVGEESNTYSIDLRDNDEEAIAFPETYKNSFWPFPDGANDVVTIEAWIRDTYKDTSEDTDYFHDAMEEVKRLVEITEEVRKNYSAQWNKLISFDDEKMADNRDSLIHTPFDDITDMNFSLPFRYDVPNTSGSVTSDEIDLQRETYKNVISFIFDCSKRKHSFALKYLQFKTLGMSAGERSLQSFYSWLNEIPMLVEKMDLRVAVVRKEPQESDYKLKDSILLLLDEPDLYMHPQWQKNLINDLINGLNCQYKDKTIQVIMTTSSPITLSDVPVENTIYIRYDRDEDKRIILPHLNGYEKQTFGADIYKLYANSFFISGSPMGAFAENYINEEILNPLKEIREEISRHELIIARGNVDTERFDTDDFRKKLDNLKWKIDILGCTPLHRKVKDMCADIEEWCKNDTNRL